MCTNDHFSSLVWTVCLPLALGVLCPILDSDFWTAGSMYLIIYCSQWCVWLVTMCSHMCRFIEWKNQRSVLLLSPPQDQAQLQSDAQREAQQISQSDANADGHQRQPQFVGRSELSLGEKFCILSAVIQVASFFITCVNLAGGHPFNQWVCAGYSELFSVFFWVIKICSSLRQTPEEQAVLNQQQTQIEIQIITEQDMDRARQQVLLPLGIAANNDNSNDHSNSRVGNENENQEKNLFESKDKNSEDLGKDRDNDCPICLEPILSPVLYENAIGDGNNQTNTNNTHRFFGIKRMLLPFSSKNDRSLLLAYKCRNLKCPYRFHPACLENAVRETIKKRVHASHDTCKDWKDLTCPLCRTGLSAT